MLIRKSFSFLNVTLMALFTLLTATSQAQAVEVRKGDKVKVGYASVTGSRISLWAAEDIGFFARQGLQPELIFVATSAQGMPALISGDIAIFSGSPETAA